MIPVLGVPILNRPDLLYRMLGSIDHPVGQAVVVDNGGLFERSILPAAGEAEILRLRGRLAQAGIISPSHNLGVSASWNLIMKSTPVAAWWLIVNHDVEFGPGDLAKVERVVQNPEAGLIQMAGFAAFAMKPAVLERVGYFDENFHPAYDEDLDYARRCRLAGIPVTQLEGLGLKHLGSSTIYADDYYRRRNGKTHGANDEYYTRKWGGLKEGGETFDTPFNRGGHLGEWRLEPNRLREQLW